MTILKWTTLGFGDTKWFSSTCV